MKTILVAALIAAGSQAAEAAGWLSQSVGENFSDCVQSAQERFDGCLESSSYETIHGEMACVAVAKTRRDDCNARYAAAIRWINRSPTGGYAAHYGRRRNQARAEMSGACEPIRDLQSLWGRF